MIRFMLVCFLFLGWAFYELSGGADFEPERRAEAEPAGVPAPAPVVEEVLASVAEPEVVTETPEQSIQDRLATALVDVAVDNGAAVVIEAAAEAVTLPLAVEAPEEETPVEVVAEVVEPVVEPAPVDLRQVAGSRVNMRSGPSTDFSVLITLDGGTTTEVIDRNDDGWVLVRVQGTGQEGWMAERLLEPVNG